MHWSHANQFPVLLTLTLTLSSLSIFTMTTKTISDPVPLGIGLPDGQDAEGGPPVVGHLYLMQNNWFY